MENKNENTADILLQSAQLRDAAIADLEAIAAAGEQTGATLFAALSAAPANNITVMLEGMNLALLTAQNLTQTLQAGLVLDTSTLGEDGLLGLLDELTARSDGITEFFSGISGQAEESFGWLSELAGGLGGLFDLSAEKGIEQTASILEQLGIRQGFLEEDRLLQATNELLANDQKLAGLQTFLGTALGIKTENLTAEQGLDTTFQAANLLGLQGFEGVALGLKTAAANAGVSVEAEGQNAEGKVTAAGLTDKLQMTSQVLGGLSGLMESENKHLFRVGQAAAIAEAGVSTALGAIKAYQSMASIPIVGPGLGAAAAAAVVIGGAKSISDIASQKPGSSKRPSGGFTAPKPRGAGAVPSIGVPKLPDVGGTASKGGKAKELQVHITDKAILELISKASRDGRLVIDAKAVV